MVSSLTAGARRCGWGSVPKLHPSHAVHTCGPAIPLQLQMARDAVAGAAEGVMEAVEPGREMVGEVSKLSFGVAACLFVSTISGLLMIEAVEWMRQVVLSVVTSFV